MAERNSYLCNIKVTEDDYRDLEKAATARRLTVQAYAKELICGGDERMDLYRVLLELVDELPRGERFQPLKLLRSALKENRHVSGRETNWVSYQFRLWVLSGRDRSVRIIPKEKAPAREGTWYEKR